MERKTIINYYLGSICIDIRKATYMYVFNRVAIVASYVCICDRA